MWQCGEGALEHRRDGDRITLHQTCVKLIRLNIASRPSRKCRKVAPRTVIVNARSRAGRTVGALATRLDDDEHGAILTGVMAGSMSAASNVSCGGARSRPHLMHAYVAASQPNHGVSDPSKGRGLHTRLTGGVAHAMVCAVSQPPTRSRAPQNAARQVRTGRSIVLPRSDLARAGSLIGAQR